MGWDPVAINNERAKLVAAFFNALGPGLIAVSVVAPLAGAVASASEGGLPEWPAWLLIGLAVHGAAHYALGYLKTGSQP